MLMYTSMSYRFSGNFSSIKASLMSFQGTLDDLSMKHYMYERIGNVGLTISTASFVLAYEISFETT